MKRLLLCLVICISTTSLSLHATQEDMPLLITEVLSGTTAVPDTNDPTNTLGGGNAEYVELYNPNDIDYPLGCVALQYASGLNSEGQPNWGNSKVTFASDQVLPPRSFGVVATDVFMEQFYPEFSDPTHADSTFRIAGLSSGLAAADRSLRLVEFELLTVDDTTSSCATNNPTVLDGVGWGSQAPYAEGDAPTVDMDADHSLKRRVDEDSFFIDTNFNGDHQVGSQTALGDFLLSASPHYLPEPTEPDTDTNPDPDAPSNPPSTPETPAKTYSTVLITELFIDPKSPMTDANDEFVELYNPHSKPVSLDGYIIQTGSRLQYTFEITDVTLAPKSYIAFESRDSGLVLANAGGKAQVIAPDGSIVADMVSYEKSPAGQSWAKFGTDFTWTSALTPGQANRRAAAQSTTARKTSTTKTTTKKSYAKIVITEVLPDPASPKLDKNDEFVELYNPNTFAVNVSGYKLKTGKSLSTSQTLEELILQPGQYVALFSADNKMSLGNGGGQAQLQDPNGTPLSTVKEYGKAEQDTAWAFISGDWQWTAKPTPAAKNVLLSAQEAQQQADVNSSGGSVLSASTGNALAQPATIPLEQANLSVVAAAGVAALLYGVYEFRHDISHRIHHYRRYFISGGKNS